MLWVIVYIVLATCLSILLAAVLVGRFALLEVVLARLLARAVKAESFERTRSNGQRSRVERSNSGAWY